MGGGRQQHKTVRMQTNQHERMGIAQKRWLLYMEVGLNPVVAMRCRSRQLAPSVLTAIVAQDSSPRFSGLTLRNVRLDLALDRMTNTYSHKSSATQTMPSLAVCDTSAQHPPNAGSSYSG